MTTPRTMHTVLQAAEKAGERLYEQRRRHVQEAARARLDATPEPAQPGSEPGAELSALEGQGGG